MLSSQVVTLFLAFGAMTSGKSWNVQKTNPTMGHNQNKMNTFLNTLAEGKWKSYSPYEYNPDFRPPPQPPTTTGSEGGEDDDITPNPTIVTISFKDLIVKSLNLTVEGEEKVELEGIFVRQHVDSRLQFVVPSPHPGVYRNEIIRTDYGADGTGSTISIWKPTIKSVILDEFDPNYWNSRINDVTLFNQIGEVYDQKTVTIVPKTPPIVSNNHSRFTFGVELTEKRFPIEDLMLEVGSENSISLKNEGSAIVESLSGEKYRFTPSFGKCKRVESYGPFGKEEYSCLKLEFAFELV